MDIPAGLLDSDAPVQAMKELHKVNDYKVILGVMVQVQNP